MAESSRGRFVEKMGNLIHALLFKRLKPLPSQNALHHRLILSSRKSPPNYGLAEKAGS